jgi:YbgC/YbaW family acyl-CoA thioester hydrolase
MFETNFKVRSTQVDTFGHLNNAAYLEIYEWARWEWSENGGFDPHIMIEERGIGPAIVHIDLSFSKEIRIHEEITVRTWFSALKDPKGVIAQEMIDKDGTIASKVLITFVMFNLKTRKITRQPDEMQALFDQDRDYRQSIE